MKIIINFIINLAAVFLTAYLLPGITIEGGYEPLIVTALVIAVLNAVLAPILVIITFPIGLMTFGLFSLVINGIVILVAAEFVPEFHVAHFGWAILFAIVMSTINSVLKSVFEA